MTRILLMITSTWMLEFYPIYNSKNERNYVSYSWITGITLINLLETLYLMFSEIFG